MKSHRVLKILHVTRQTLVKYVKNGDIRVTLLPNGNYEYNDEDVYRKSGLATDRVSVIYSRVSTQKQKQDLENQEKALMLYCNAKGVQVSQSYKDIASGMSLDREQFRLLLDEVLAHKVKAVYVMHKDRFSRVSFDLFSKLFAEFGCEVVVVNDVEDAKTNEREIFEEIISMLHCFAMRMYSARRKKKLQLIKEDLINEISD